MSTPEGGPNGKSKRTLTFVHDGPVFYETPGDYYEFAYHGLRERYAHLADKIQFLLRIKHDAKSTKYTPLNSEVAVVPVPNIKSPSRLIKNLRRARKIIDQTVKDSDIVVLRMPSLTSIIAQRSARRLGRPAIVECVGCAWDSYWNYGALGKLVAPYMYLSMRRAIRRADYVIYVTEKFLQGRYPTSGRSTDASNVVMPEVSDDVLTQRLGRIADMSTNADRPYILGTAAALDTPHKGQAEVIRALPRLNSGSRKFVYRLAGGYSSQRGSTYLKDLSEKLGVQDSVEFMGSLNAQEMNIYYDSLDIYIQPSRQEGLPRAVIEAMSRALPVLGSSAGGIPELIEPECVFGRPTPKVIEGAVHRLLATGLHQQAARNFAQARRYEFTALNARRQRFYDLFTADQFPRKGCDPNDAE